MPIVMVYDTETTGLRKSGLPDPRLMQFAALVGNHKGQIFSTASFLASPDREWIVQPGASSVHGITIEQCRMYGYPMGVIIYTLEKMASMANTVVAFNETYDRQIIETELKIAEKEAPAFDQRPAVCIMKTMTDICKIPHAFRRSVANQWKWPKQEEAYAYLFGEQLVGAHDALVDVRATYRMYCTLYALGIKLESTHGNGGATDGGSPATHSSPSPAETSA